MKTFLQFTEEAAQNGGVVSEAGFVRGIIDRFKKKKKPAVVDPYKKERGEGSAAYKTNHHYGHGDIEPSSVPVFHPSWKTAGRPAR